MSCPLRCLVLIGLLFLQGPAGRAAEPPLPAFPGAEGFGALAKGGRGGRATEFLLGAAIALQGEARVHVLAADTDGIDGVEDNAGAIVTPDTLARAQAQGLKAQEYLDRNDAYRFFEALGDLVVTGPTFTNVNDFRAMLIA